MRSFVPLHVHSNYSLCRGASTIGAICRHARDQGCTHLAITDTNGLYGLGWFLQEARDLGLQPVIGAFLKTPSCHAVVLVKNFAGYGRLNQLITAIHQDTYFDLSSALLNDHRELIILTNHLALLQACVQTNKTTDVYVEVIPYANREEMVQFARRNQLPVAASQAAYFITEEDFALHRLLRAIDLNVSLSTIPREELAHPHASMAPIDSYFPDCPEAISNTLQIAQNCSFDLDFGHAIFPSFQGPQGEDSHVYLDEQVRKGVLWRYGRMTLEIQKRMEYELQLIKSKGFAPYFLVVADAVRQAPRTCGRGSAASSLVSYSLGITNVDPIKYDLFFDRFLNPGRKDPPDIDVDFPWDERDDVLDYLFKKYGSDRIAMIANHNTFKARSALHEIAKVYGLPESEITQVTKRISGYWQPDRIDNMVSTHPLFKNIELTPPWPEMIAWAERIRGYPRHLSIHCGGVVIAPDGLHRYVPVQPAKKILKIYNAEQDGMPHDVSRLQVVQWEKDQAEDMGLIKMDILGNRSLAVIRDAIKAVEKNFGLVLDYATWDPLQDPATQALLARGDTIGVFYVESPAMRQLQIKTGKGDFEHLVIHSSIIRPAANIYINEYVRRLRGAAYEPLHPQLQEILKETFGIMVYQEDVSKVAMALANFDSSAADDLRKIIAKKHAQKKLHHYRERFFQGAQENKVSLETCEKIWDMILSFSDYSFCKPHSASYAQVSFKSAWLKAHYPAEFIAAVIANRGGYYSTFAYISEARRMGLKILSLDINESDVVYTGNKDSIRVGFMQIKGLSQKIIQTILQIRKQNTAFHSFDHFLERAQPDPADAALLIKAGCFDALEPHTTRPALLWRMHHWHALGQKRNRQTLFAELDASGPTLPTPAPYDDKTVLQHEIECLGFLLSRHPLSLFQKSLAKQTYVRACDLHQHIGKNVQTIGWLITYKLSSTKNKELMEFISFEDTTAIYETIFFPPTYARYAYMMNQSKPFLLAGRVEEQYGAIILNVTEVKYL
jgi:error-prone DNA polymerase